MDLHEYRSALAQLLHYIAVMDDFMVNIDWSPIRLKRQFNDVHGTHHSGAKPAWPDAHQHFVALAVPAVSGPLNLRKI